MPKCIFIARPKECSICLDARILQCLLDKQHLKIREEAKEELVALLVKNIESPTRYKTTSGEEGRHH